jgi:hypothetical protein
LLASQGRGHPLFHHSKQQGVFAFEMVKRRAALHANGGGNIACGGCRKTLASKKRCRSLQ